MFKKHLTSIKARIVTITITYALLISILIVSVFFYIFQAFLQENLVRSTEFNLQFVSDSVSNDVNQLIYFARWCCSNDVINSYLTFDEEDDKSISLSTFNRLSEEYRNTKAYKYIERVVISKNNGKFLQLVSTVSSSTMDAAAIIKESSFFNPLLENDGFQWIGIVDNPFTSYTRGNSKIIPIVRPILDKHGTEVVGWVYLGISADIITDYFTEYNLPEGSSLYITIADNVYQIKDDTITSVEPFAIKKSLENVANSRDTLVYIADTTDSKDRTIVSSPSLLKGWYLSQSISKAELYQQRQFYHFFIYLILLLLMGLGFALLLYFNRTINKPIGKIRKKLAAISKGDFTYDSSIEWEHELGEIGRGINRLSQDITALMDKRIEDEKQQKDLEYQILLSQINPHFLYNTLNSIKWMATIQQAEGIAEMTTALARLMKNISKGTTQLITIEEELALLKDYFLIQQYRYGGAVTMEYNIDEAVYPHKILRFTLQPLVENALFHGIEPKGGTGKITITITTDYADKIDIFIMDNGVGMTKEQIEKSLYLEVDNITSDFFKKIGISNVNRRLQYEFGSSYGITITSKPGEYTKMHIRLPYTTSERSL
ncbi:sensor histidine kinase [Konateibacter massiliensis]|uniref:sensor histidine kinase n=1 Tax=Konateibacter massiliensis TaxID=2002841 RepID=UPI000C14802A|nr:sensor histidine kinase [Konateibacter massiliensis]